MSDSSEGMFPHKRRLWLLNTVLSVLFVCLYLIRLGPYEDTVVSAAFLWVAVAALVVIGVALVVTYPVVDWSGTSSRWGRIADGGGVEETDRSVGDFPVYETTVDGRTITCTFDPDGGGPLASLLTVETPLAVGDLVRCEAALDEAAVDVPATEYGDPVGTLTADGDEGTLRLAVRRSEPPADPGILREHASTVADVAASVEREGLSVVDWSERTRSRPAPSGSGAGGTAVESDPDREPP